jgi:hypothetical protein
MSSVTQDAIFTNSALNINSQDLQQYQHDKLYYKENQAWQSYHKGT